MGTQTSVLPHRNAPEKEANWKKITGQGTLRGTKEISFLLVGGFTRPRRPAEKRVGTLGDRKERAGLATVVDSPDSNLGQVTQERGVGEVT